MTVFPLFYTDKERAQVALFLCNEGRRTMNVPTMTIGAEPKDNELALTRDGKRGRVKLN